MASKKVLVDLDLSGNKVTGLPTPSANSDAATKKYVDDNSGDGGGTSINYDDMSKYRSNKDSGIFKTIIWKDDNDKMRKKSELSGGTAPNFTTRTITYYDDTETLTDTLVYTLDYDGSDDFIEEVLN